MSQSPWSVKGIDPKARAAAREQADRRGMTLGEYLNSMLLESDSSGPPDSGLSPVHGGAQIVSLTRGDGGPDDIRRLSSEIDRLAQKLEAAQVRSQRSMSGVDRSVLGLMGKVDATGRAQLQALERVAHTLSDIEAMQNALRTRIETIETDGTSGGKSADALRSLETSLGRLAETVQVRTSAIEREQADFRDLFEQKVEGVTERVDTFARSIDGVVGDAVRRMEQSILDTAETRTRGVQSQMSGRIDQIDEKVTAAERRMEQSLGRISDAASRFEQFETKAERAVTDTTGRMERALQASVDRSRQMSREVLDRVESIEDKTREAVSGLSDAMSRIGERLARAERTSGAAVANLERTLQALDERVQSQRGGVASEEVAQLKTAFQRRMDTLAEDLSRPMQTMRAEMERKLEEAMRSASPEKFDRLERSIRGLQDRLEKSETLQADAVEGMSAQVERMSRAVDERLRQVEANPSGVSIDDVRRELNGLAESIDEKLADGLEMRISAQEMGSRELVRSLDERFKKVDEARARDRAALTEQITEAADLIQRRNDEGLQILQMRIDEAKLGDGSQDFSSFATAFEQRVKDSERRSAEAIVQIGEQVARVADRLATQHVDSLRSLEGRLAESERLHETRLQDALNDMSRRLDELGDHTAGALNPVHNTVSSLARRLAEIEDRKGAAQHAVHPARTVNPPEIFDEEETVIEGAPAPLIAPAARNDDFLVIDEFAGRYPQDPEPANDADIVGVEPPPFDRVVEAKLFGEDPPAQVAPLETAHDAPAAQSVDDLLDADDDVLEPPPAAERPADRYVADLPEASDRPGEDYLAQARKAAQHGNRVPLAMVQPAGKRGMGKGLVAASAVTVLAVAGGGYWTFMRGKQEPAGEGFAKAEPSSPEAPATSDPHATSAVLFDGHAEAAPSPAPTVAAERATAAELFDDHGAHPAAAPAGAPAHAAPAAAPAEAPRAITIEQAAASGDPVALYDLAGQLIGGEDKSRAIGLFREAANKGLVMAQYRLAKLYERGEGVPRDMSASRQWTERAAIGGNTKAMHDLAVFFAEGDAGPQSYVSAVQWFRQAADHGLVDSQFNLAVLYQDGRGVSQDLPEAAFWYELAGRAGDTDGRRRAGELLAQMDNAAAEQVRRRARAWNARPAIARANGEFGRRAWEMATPEQVSEAQRLLTRLGYSPGTPDGRTGQATVNAIRAFERDSNLPVSGEATATLLRQLRQAALNAGG
jgi:localization factor PodJL